MAVGIYKKMARDIMTKSVATVRENETLHDALMLLTENRLTALPVVDAAGRCLGMISQSDVIAVAREADAENQEMGSDHPMADVLFGRVSLDEVTNERIDDIMTEGVVTAAPTDLITSIADKMLSEKVHHLPVCDEDGCLLGIISTMDILAALRAPVSV
jgi:CBS domain-containing protein